MTFFFVPAHHKQSYLLLVFQSHDNRYYHHDLDDSQSMTDAGMINCRGWLERKALKVLTTKNIAIPINGK